MKIKELLDSPEKWTKDTYARDKDGNSRWPNELDVCCWCLLGATYKCYGEIDEQRSICNRIRERVRTTSVQDWNDAPERTFDDVKKLVEELDI